MKIAAVDWVEGDVVSPRKNEFDAAHASADAAPGRKPRLLVFTSLYPNAAQPRHGMFVEERLRHLLDSDRITATVVGRCHGFRSSTNASALTRRLPGRRNASTATACRSCIRVIR